MTCHLEAGSEPTSRTGSFEVWLPGPRGRTGCRFPVADDRGALGDQRGRAPDLDRSAKRCPEERMPKDHRGGEQEPARGERTEPPPPGGGEEHARLVRAALDGVPERVEQLADLGGGVHERTLPSALGPANEAPNGEELIRPLRGTRRRGRSRSGPRARARASRGAGGRGRRPSASRRKSRTPRPPGAVPAA